MRQLLAQASARLAAAGVPSPEFDAAELLAHVIGESRGTLLLRREISAGERQRYEELLRRREAREPLQHLLGTAAFRYQELAVGPGVFTPRPETELLAGWAIEQLAGHPDPVVVDLCTGSGAIALSIATEVPQARVYAVELDPPAYDWASRNLTGSGVDLRLGDMAEAFRELDGTVDVVVCNPPYIPLTAWESVAAEARDHDPDLALFSGEDGLDAIRVAETVAGRLLRPGGVVGVEHADVQGESVPAVFAETGRWVEIADHRDLADKPRWTTARRVQRQLAPTGTMTP